ncbi:MAG TPA: pitrilysin family protein [Planctomycetota bacterium]|jgi:predicted Zn-dependent peptidase|nr:pitrilysin family protein [Planctomycetota bacterium]
MNLRRRASRILREEIVSAVLPCGLPCYAVPKRGFDKKIAIFAARYGSLDLEFAEDGGRAVRTPPGIAHFLEHQLFKKAGGEDVLMEFGKYGASSNAFTDYCATAYYFTASGQFEKNLELLLTFVTTPYFEDEYVAKERLIIEQELRMYDDSPDHRLYRNLMSVLYTEHPVRIDIGGTVEDLQKIDRPLLEACYRTFYNPGNMALVVAGDLDPAAVFRHAARTLSKDGFRPRGPIRRNLPAEPPGVRERVVRAEMAVSLPRVLVGFKDLDVDPRTAMQRELETSVVLDLLFGRGSAFYTRAYEEGLIDDSFSFSYNSEDPFGFSLIGGETEEPERLAERILLELHAARKRRLKKRDVERSKRKRLGKFIRSLDTPEGAAFLVLNCVQRNLDLFEVPRWIGRLSPARLEERLRDHFDERNYAVSILVPKKGAEPLAVTGA